MKNIILKSLLFIIGFMAIGFIIGYFFISKLPQNKLLPIFKLLK